MDKSVLDMSSLVSNEKVAQDFARAKQNDDIIKFQELPNQLKQKLN